MENNDNNKKENFRQLNFENFNQTTEEDVGIIEFVNKADEAFECVLKHRYSDFLVNEISENGRVIWLKITPGQESTIEQSNAQNEEQLKTQEKIGELNNEKAKENVRDESNNNDKTKNKNVLSPESIGEIVNKQFIGQLILDEEDGVKLKELIVKYIEREDYKYTLKDLKIQIKFNEDKIKRKNLHENIRKYFSFLDSEASTQKNQNTSGAKKNSDNRNQKGQRNPKQEQQITQTLDLNENTELPAEEEKKHILIFVKSLANNSQSANKQSNSTSGESYYNKRKSLPDNSKKYLYFSMQKKNMEIIQAINFIARALKRSSKSLGYAGNKDKRGITTQLISIYNTLPEEVISLSQKPFWERRIQVGNFFFAENALKLGQLRGNQFCVALRFLKGNRDSVVNRIESIRKNGFLNYYGMQRFGCSCIPTHKIGLMVIRNKWDEAVLNILNTNAVREILNVKDFKELTLEHIFQGLETLLKKISKGRSNVEFRILKSLKSNKQGFYNAFKSLNRQLQVLYPHAYQSYIWNKTVSERIKRFGLQVLIGDIVLKKGKSDEEVAADDDAALVEAENIELGENDDVTNDIEDDNLQKTLDPSADEINKIEEMTNQVNKYKNKDFYDKFFDDSYEFITENNISQYTISDVVIPIIGTQVKYPRNETYNIIKSILSEDSINIEDLLFKEHSFNSKGHFRKFIQVPKKIEFEFIQHDDPDEDLLNENYNLEPHPEKNGTKYTSLRLVFQLPQSTYATMLFRELTRTSSDSKVQAGLSQKINEN